jgi:hypothetical protein
VSLEQGHQGLHLPEGVTLLRAHQSEQDPEVSLPLAAPHLVQGPAEPLEKLPGV